MTPAVVFDDGLGELAPLTHLRAAFDVRTGALTTLERLRHTLGLQVVSLYVPEALADLTAEAHDLPINRLPSDMAEVFVINGRCPIPPEQLRDPEPGVIYVEPETNTPVGGKLALIDAIRVLVGETPDVKIETLEGPVLMNRPWHFRSVRDHAIRFDLELIRSTRTFKPVPEGVLVIGERDRVLVDHDATVYPGATLDVEDGPISIAGGAVLRPGAVVIGPTAIGPHSVISEHAVIRANTAIGRRCKIGGEVAGTVFQGFANKVHDGYLGDSWVGEWSNLGAGTTNSNLLNTYSEIVSQATPGGRREHTGETFLGAMIGDHVKTAIGTRIMTGSVIHTGSMWAASAAVSGCVEPFAWVTDAGRRRYRLDKFLDVMGDVMARRDVEPSDAYVERLRGLHGEARGANE
uniref:Nucleoside-diphosphate-sugar pyrophosphorylase involved in lipopolysaccharide biosynthesis/translation initiation factor 2B, gamma/epsilon subunits (EIF-2Bgamma/eIF-2Bepsilon) n=1 Tax=uncultured Planctomycetales bacterium HF0500_02G17 TaxID=723608 RepID=E7C4L6_9BACT|nr:nucleoside-diphosphate-sugar pyrophosphorylase involved in lipopolysaccharide biosynthesis/translation initiation factor 2B, gamma/epsilon subunits (eIF-2Bgamma/eIF-2Bepsilon) [uncultured Planctomycetales bacterium HF0500_02G17]